jgi:hypothetical protein
VEINDMMLCDYLLQYWSGEGTNIVADFLLCFPEVFECKQEYGTCCNMGEGVYNAPSAAI